MAYVKLTIHHLSNKYLQLVVYKLLARLYFLITKVISEGATSSYGSESAKSVYGLPSGQMEKV